MIDQTKAVRAGEELDAKKLADWLGVASVEIAQFPSGHSNLTYLVKSGSDEWVLRRPPFGSKVKTAHDMGREYRILERLHGHYPVPKPLRHCEDESVIGAPFYLMERLRGVIPRLDPPREWKEDPALVTRIGESVVDNLKRLHALDWKALGFEGKPEGYVERQVNGWHKRWRESKIDDVPDMEWMAEWLHARLPQASGATLIHNDYKYDNLVFAEDEPAKIIGVLDWEMSTIGDPMMDLGTALGYWVEATDPGPVQMVRLCATTIPGSLTRHQIMARYGVSPEQMLFYYCFALWKNATVGQQIYFRFHQGLTKDPRFAALGQLVPVLASLARQVAESGKF